MTPALAAIDRSLRDLRERAATTRAPMLGCSTVSHERLGYCAGCARVHRDNGPNGPVLEVLGWRLLALRDAEASDGSQPEPLTEKQSHADVSLPTAQEREQ